MSKERGKEILGVREFFFNILALTKTFEIFLGCLKNFEASSRSVEKFQNFQSQAFQHGAPFPRTRAFRTIKIADRSTIQNLIEPMLRFARSVRQPRGCVPCRSERKFRSFASIDSPCLRWGQTGFRKVHDRATISRVISVITPGLVTGNAVSSVISR